MYPLFRVKYLICFLTFFLLIHCRKDDPINPNDQPDKPFYLENLGVRFGPWDTVTNLAGDFFFLSDQTKVFYEFGFEVLAHDGSMKRLPHFTYSVRKDAPVLAAAELVIYHLIDQGNGNDYELFTRSIHDPSYEVLYDHLSNLTVEVGDTVSAGDTLGYPRTITPAYGFFEFMINNTKTHYSYCPFCCFNPGTRSSYEQQVAQFMRDWEAYKNDSSIYDDAEHISPGCLLDSIS